MDHGLLAELVERFNGPMSARLLIQPAIACFFAVRDGVRDARDGAPPYLYALAFRSGERRARISGAWASAGKVAIMAFVLDCVFQYVADGAVRVIEAVFMAFLLCALPYTLLRGPASRVMRRRLEGSR